jgi:ribosomal protein S18 acetylase RimI-like enzyme
MTVSRRPESPGDGPFVRRLILETVAAELGAALWPEPMRSHLLGIQYTGRRQSLSANFPDAATSIIQADGTDAGWTVAATFPDEVRLVELIVAPELRNRGIGSAVIREFLAEAASTGKPLRLHVNATNRQAQALYERLGFRRVDANEVQYFLESREC